MNIYGVSLVPSRLPKQAYANHMTHLLVPLSAESTPRWAIMIGAYANANHYRPKVLLDGP
jgi:hypothetical protein